MSQSSRVPPYLPDLIGDDEIAEATFTFGEEGDSVTLVYRPAILLRAAQAQAWTSDQRWRWVRSALAEAREWRQVSTAFSTLSRSGTSCCPPRSSWRSAPRGPLG